MITNNQGGLESKPINSFPFLGGVSLLSSYRYFSEAIMADVYIYNNLYIIYYSLMFGLGKDKRMSGIQINSIILSLTYIFCIQGFCRGHIIRSLHNHPPIPEDAQGHPLPLENQMAGSQLH